MRMYECVDVWMCDCVIVWILILFSIVPWEDSFYCTKWDTVKGVGAPVGPCVGPVVGVVGAVLSNETHGIEKSTFGVQHFSIRSQNVGIMMESWWWYHDLKIWNAPNLIMSNFENQEILIQSKFENTKNLIMSNFWHVPKIWSCQNLKIQKIWSCQKWESKILKNFDLDVIMISWKTFSCCACFTHGTPMDFERFIKVCFYIFIFFDDDAIMSLWSWSRNMVFPKSDDVTFWDTRNLDHVQIWEHQKSDHVKNFDMYQKSDPVKNLRTPKIWSCQKFENQEMCDCVNVWMCECMTVWMFDMCAPVDHSLCLQTTSNKAIFLSLWGSPQNTPICLCENIQYFFCVPLWATPYASRQLPTRHSFSSYWEVYKIHTCASVIILVSWWSHDDGTMISKFEMPQIWSCQILKIKKSWSSQNLKTQKIWSCQTFDMYQKSDHVKIWKSKKSDHVKNGNPRFWKISILMSSWYHGKLFLAVLVSHMEPRWILNVL